MLVTINPQKISLPPGSEVILHHQTWSNYEEILNIRQDKTYPKIYFNDYRGEILLMSPLPAHGKRIDTIRDMIKLLLHYQQKDWECFDPITLKKSNQGGVEPDSCFYINNREAILGQDKIDLSQLPPPDLAIEVDFTSYTNPDYYLPLAIPELWIYKQKELLIYIYEEEKYQNSEKSIIFSEFSVKNLIPEYVEFAWHNGSSVALRKFKEYLVNNHSN
jgi:Uma2 family endonuclease